MSTIEEPTPQGGEPEVEHEEVTPQPEPEEEPAESLENDGTPGAAPPEEEPLRGA